jgi:hypothetical protein
VQTLEGLAMEDVGILYVPLVKFTANRHFLWLFGTFSPPPLLVHFYPFWYLVPRKIWQPCSWLLHTYNGEKYDIVSEKVMFKTV